MSQNQSFHNKHEYLTEKAYNDETMLPHRYVFVLTSKCNLSCHFCFQEKEVDSTMVVDDWIKLIEQIPAGSRVTLTGGEPLLYKNFKEIFNIVAKKFECNLITNGTMLTNEIIDLLLSYTNFKVLSISIDDIGNISRDVKQNNWNKMVETLDYFQTKRKEINSECLLEAKTLVLDSNASQLLDIHKYCIEKLKCNHHSFQFLKGSPLQHANYKFDFDEIFKIAKPAVYNNFETIKNELKNVQTYNIENKKVAFLHPKLSSLISDVELNTLDILNETKHNHSIFKNCKFPWSSVHVNSNGDIYPCLAVAYGNIKQSSLQEIITSSSAMQFKNCIRENGTVEACNRCGWLRLKGFKDVD